MSEEPKASRRATQALQTRQEILAAARGLFAGNGYSCTSVAQVAAAAGVSVQTIYDSLGSKRAIVLALNDLIDEEGDVRALASAIPTSTDPIELLRIAATISRNINERCGDIVAALFSAAAVETEMREVRDESRRRHRAGIAGLTRRLASLGALRGDLDAETAADVIAAMTDPQVARTFVGEYGWTWDRWQEWTEAALIRLVLEAALHGSSRRGAAPGR